MDTSPLPQGPQPASVLLLAPGFGDGDVAVCGGLLAEDEATNLLYVSWASDPSDRLASAREHGADPATTAAIVIGDARSTPEGFDAVETINAPTDLTGVGIAVTELLSSVEGPSAVCFDSVTSLLQYVDVETAFEFLHVFAGRLYRHDAVGHLHMDPGAHDDQVVARVASLVDGRVRVGEDGGVESASASLRDWSI